MDAALLDDLVDRITLGTLNDRDEQIRAIEQIVDREQCAEHLHQQLQALPACNVERHNTLLSVIGQLHQPSSIAVLEQFIWLGPDRVLPPRSMIDGGYTPLDWSLQARAAHMLAWIAGMGYRDTQLQIIRGHPHSAVRYSAIAAWLFARADDPDAADKLCALVPLCDRWAVTHAETISALSPAQFAEIISAQSLLTA